MSSSPYVPQQIKQYMRKFQIEQTINSSINQLLKLKPEDPYSYLIGEFQKKSIPDIEIIDIQMFETVSGEGFPVIKLKVTINYLNKQMNFYIDQPYGISSEENNIFDADGINGKGMKSGITFFNQKIRPILKSSKFKCSQQQQIDSQLTKSLKANQNKGLYQVNSVSFSISSLKSRVFCKPLYQIYGQLAQIQLNNSQAPRFMINCLHGGKAIGSKCKVFKYYLISKTKQALPFISTVLQNIKKSITSGKGGQAALKYSPDGTFICPLDTIMDNLKIVQDAINTSGGKDHFKIGLSWMADTLYTADTKKYQLQNPKTPFDNDQMIDYLIKLLTDKPIISYLQDPLASSQRINWVKLTKKIRQNDALKHVKIGTRSGALLNVLAENFKQKLQNLSIPVTEDSHPQLSIQERTTKNNQKIKLDCVQVRAFQFQTATNLMKVCKQLNRVGTQMILQDNAFESYNSDLVDICYGVKGYCNLGSITKFDRISKVNRAIQISQQLRH